MKRLIFIPFLFFATFGFAQETDINLTPQQKESIKKAIGSGEISTEETKKEAEKEIEVEKPEIPEIVPAEEEKAISLLEKIYNQRASLEISRNVKQFGYDIFKLPSTTFAPVKDVPVGPDYILGPGDNLVIYIWGNVQQTFSVTVDRDGKILLPESGVLYVWGLTFSQAEKLVKSVLGEVFANFQINVTMGRLRTIRVFVLGEVRKPGGYTLSSLSTLFQALCEAGGPTKLGTLRKIKLIRNNKVIDTIDLYRFLLKGDKSHDHKLFSNDTIFVPPIGPVAGIAGNVKKPGIYELLGTTEISDLIELAGGITPTAYLNKLQLERIEAHQRKILIDLEFKTAKEIRKSLKSPILQDGDLALIYPIHPFKRNYISIEGNITRPGEYELTKGMRISNLIKEAEEVLSESYLERGEIFRFKPANYAREIIPFNLKSNYAREIIPFNLGKVLEGNKNEDLSLEEWDIVKIYSIYDVYPQPMVEIKGAVNKPGIYRFIKGMRVIDLIFRGKNLKKEAYLERAELYRFREDEAREIIPINLNKVLQGDEKQNLLLEEKDYLKIYTISEVIPMFFVEVSGAVYKPGRYELTTDMKISDLIFKGGGLKRNASLKNAELYRQSQEGLPEIVNVDLNKIEKSSFSDLSLQEGDHFFIRYETEWVEKNRITLSGKVKYPGEYIVEKGEKLSDIIKRAGGFTEEAYLPSAVFTRKSVKQIQEKRMKKFVEDEQKKLLQEEANLAGISLTEGERKTRVSSLDYRKQLLESLATVEVPGRIIINLAKILDKDGSKKYDILIENGDSLNIPQIPSSVQILGAVCNSGAVLYEPGESVNYYLSKVGDMTKQADRKNIYVIRASGETISDIKKFRDRIERGDTIIVPEEFQYRTPRGLLIKDSAQVLYHLGIAAAAVASF